MKVVKSSAKVKAFWLTILADGSVEARALLLVYNNGPDLSITLANIVKILVVTSNSKKEMEYVEKLLDEAVRIARIHTCAGLFVTDRSHGIHGKCRRKVLKRRSCGKVGHSFSITMP